MKIDTSKIEGYADMTPEAKIAALEAYEDKEDDEKKKLKEAIDKAANEAATYKKKWKEKLDADEKARLEREEEINRLKAENEEFKAQSRRNRYTASFMSAGYDEETAKTLANALPEGISDEFFEAQKTFLQNEKQKAKVDKINNGPKPTPGAPITTSYLNDDFQAMLRKQSGLK